MGRQIQIHLARDDEESLIAHVRERFPYARVVDAVYPSDWDRQTLNRSMDSDTWLIVDSRAEALLCGSANTFSTAKMRELWQVRSKAFSCIEWDRGLYDSGSMPRWGRLYLDTSADPTWLDISAQTGDDVERIYDFACRWIRRRCVNCSEHRYGVWVSPSELETFRTAEAKRRTAAAKRMPDPRDARFYALQKKKRHKLADEELTLYVSYCDKMIEYVNKDSAAAHAWRQLREELRARIGQ
jgi:hypothetical protein